MDQFPEFSKYDKIAFDTEDDGLHWPVNKLFGFSIATPDGQSVYHDIRHTPSAIDWFNYEMSNFKGRIICHPASFDYKMAMSAGLNIPMNRLDDTIIRACLIDEHEHSYSLDALCEKYLGDRKVSDIYMDLAEMFGGRATRNVQMKNLHLAPPELVRPYAAKDALLTYNLWEWQEKEIERQGIQDIVEFERRVMVPIIKAQVRGIRVDLNRAEEAIKQLDKEIISLFKELKDIIGKEINVNSPKQVREVFNPRKNEVGHWVADNGTALDATDSGAPSLDSESLRKMENDPRAQLILTVRSAIKTRDTFLAGHILGHAVGDRVYPTINQNKGEDAGTGTGRLSYTDPAMQQIPSRNKKIAAIVKPIFLPDEGHKWVSFDMHSFEVRVFAHLVNNPVINNKYADNPTSDFHAMVAELTGLPRDAAYSGQANAKQLNLSMIFNSGNGAIADKMGMDWEWSSFLPKGKADKPENYITFKKAGEEALAVIKHYHANLPGVKDLADKAKQIAEQYGYVTTKVGRRLRFPRKFKTYKASGLCIQATAADINKHMWMETDNLDYGHLILNTHDSYELSVQMDKSGQEIKEELQDKIKSAVPWFRVPLIVDLNGEGSDWWDALNKKKKK
jgi:DNA polymerase I-like protein with 3'-5' exonuclease and polymerase domains